MAKENVTQDAHYRKIMKEIPFMENYIQESEIFNPNSDKCKNFLIQCFCHLHPDFNYLLYLKNEDVNLEIMKAAGILQIYPTNLIQKNIKLFDNMCSEDIHKFWIKLFTLFKKDSVIDNNFNLQNNLFKDMKNTVNYLNFELPVINANKLKINNVNNEIQKWLQEDDTSVTLPTESTCVDDEENEEICDIDIEKLLMESKKVLLMFHNKKCSSLEYVPTQTEFFLNFINLTKNILKYKTNLNIIDSKNLDEFNFSLISNNDNLTECLYFIKRCNNFVNSIKNKIKAMHYKVFKASQIN